MTNISYLFSNSLRQSKDWFDGILGENVREMRKSQKKIQRKKYIRGM